MKKLILYSSIGLLAYLVFSLLSAPTIHAAWYNLSTDEFSRKVTGKQKLKSESKETAQTNIFKERYNYSTTNDFYASTGLMILNNDATSPSAFNSISSGIAFLTSQRPATTQQYLAYMSQKAGFVEPAYAQGAGFRGLNKVQSIWVATRNVAYLFTSLVLVVVGFMIMLRKKIDPQTVIGIQQALPRIVVTLLLITFSYAIVGLVIDLMYFIIYLSINLADTFGVYSEPNKLREILLGHSALGIGIRDLFWSREGGFTAADAVGQMVKDLLDDTGGAIAGIGDVLSQPIAYLIIAVAILWASFKLFFTLLMAYIQIILSAIIAPFQLMLNAVPGSESFGKWFRNLLANAAAFPAAAIMFLLGAALLGLNETWGVSENIGFLNDVTGGSGFLPPFIGGSGPTNPIQGLIGLGIILMTPKVVEMTKEALQAPEFKYTSAIGEAVGFGGSTFGKGGRLAGGYAKYAGLVRKGEIPHYLQYTDPELFAAITKGIGKGEGKVSNLRRMWEGIQYTAGRRK